MTREEAISIINVIIHMLEPQYDNDRVEEAVDMAIKALEQEPVYFPPCVDCNSKMNEIREAYDNLKKQEPSEWQQDHAILKAHSDGANEVLDRIKEAREEIANYSDYHRQNMWKANPLYDVEQGRYLAYEKCLSLLDKLIAEVEEKA
jgi:hypothetical protein